MNENEGKIIVRGDNVLSPPLLVTAEAKVVEFYDSFGELTALLIRGILGPDMWAFANKLDDDWPQVLIRFGYRDVLPEELKRIKEGL